MSEVLCRLSFYPAVYLFIFSSGCRQCLPLLETHTNTHTRSKPHKPFREHSIIQETTFLTKTRNLLPQTETFLSGLVENENLKGVMITQDHKSCKAANGEFVKREQARGYGVTVPLRWQRHEQRGKPKPKIMKQDSEATSPQRLCK